MGTYRNKTISYALVILSLSLIIFSPDTSYSKGDYGLGKHYIPSDSLVYLRTIMVEEEMLGTDYSVVIAGAQGEYPDENRNLPREKRKHNAFYGFFIINSATKEHLITLGTYSYSAANPFSNMFEEVRELTDSHAVITICTDYQGCPFEKKYLFDLKKKSTLESKCLDISFSLFGEKNAALYASGNCGSDKLWIKINPQQDDINKRYEILDVESIDLERRSDDKADEYKDTRSLPKLTYKEFSDLVPNRGSYKDGMDLPFDGIIGPALFSDGKVWFAATFHYNEEFSLESGIGCYDLATKKYTMGYTIKADDASISRIYKEGDDLLVYLYRDGEFDNHPNGFVKYNIIDKTAKEYDETIDARAFYRYGDDMYIGAGIGFYVLKNEKLTHVTVIPDIDGKYVIDVKEANQ